MRVVRHIQYQGGLTGNNLESPGQIDDGQAGAHCLGSDREPIAQRLERRKRSRGVEQLVRPAQRRIRHGVEPLVASGPTPLLLVA